MKPTIFNKFIILAAGLALMLVPYIARQISLWAAEPITIESLESITGPGVHVFNEIQFVRGADTDLWLMGQSHYGFALSRGQWDRLAIVVDKNAHRASFYQLAPGTLGFDSSKMAPLKISCMNCHSNGPRAIRPNFLSRDAPISLGDRIKMALWNIRIKTYGHTENLDGAKMEGGQPLTSPLPVLDRALALGSCALCHSPHGIRNTLRVEQLATVKFMVQNGFMPPFPFRVSAADRATINRLAP